MPQSFENLNKLSEKLYHEGVEKARIEAEKLLEIAREEANLIKQGAIKEAEGLLVKAKDQAENIRNRTNDDLKVAYYKVREEAKNLITRGLFKIIIKEPVQQVLNSKDWYSDFIVSLIKEKWQSPNSLELPAKFEGSLRKAISNDLPDALNGLKISFSHDLSAGFRVVPEDGGYYIAMEEEDFNQWFADFLREESQKLLFKE